MFSSINYAPEDGSIVYVKDNHDSRLMFGAYCEGHGRAWRYADGPEKGKVIDPQPLVFFDTEYEEDETENGDSDDDEL